MTQHPAAMRIGHGWDMHRLEPRAPAGAGRRLVIGGVEFEHERGPVAHSDGDVLMHALTDALLGAIGAPDIGQLFPDHAPENDWRDSRDFLLEAARRVRDAGWQVVNADMTVVCERPKMGARKSEIVANLSHILGVPAADLNLKGKTHERVDAVGEGRAIEAHAVVLLVRA